MTDKESLDHHPGEQISRDEDTTLTNNSAIFSKTGISVHDSTDGKIADSIETMESPDHLHADEKLSELWKDALDVNLSSPEMVQVALEKTFQLLDDQVQDVIWDGLDAIQERDRLKEQVKQLQDESMSKKSEIERLRSIEEKQRSTIQNLLRAAETSTSIDPKHILEESVLRSDLASATKDKNAALLALDASAGQISLLQEELHRTKAKLRQMAIEKVRLKRDQRTGFSSDKNLSHLQKKSKPAVDSVGNAPAGSKY